MRLAAREAEQDAEQCSAAPCDPQLPVVTSCYRDIPFVRLQIGFGVVRRPTTYPLLRVFCATIIPFDSE
jgi:hypothetical protein